MNGKWHAPCLRGVIGNWVYYATLMSAETISARVMKAQNIREARALEDHLQRNLKPRVAKIAAYLKKRDDRFFGSIILGVFGGLPDWIELDLSVVIEKLEISNPHKIEESLGLLVFHGNEKIFAIDGQQRVEGIKEASVASDRLENDEFPILLVAHKDDTAGKVRTRRLFSDINKNAVAVSEGDRVVIDEDEPCAIVTRRLYAEFPRFKGGSEIAVTEKKEQLSEGHRECFTSLLGVHTVCKRLKKLHKKPRGMAENATENITAFQGTVRDFFNFAIEHEPSLRSYFIQGTTTLRDQRANNRSLFFRPVGLEVLARAYAHFFRKGRLDVLEYALRTVTFENPGGVFDGILWNGGRIEAKAKAKTAAVDLLLYLLGELNLEREEKLTAVLRELTKDQRYALPRKASLPRRKAGGLDR